MNRHQRAAFRSGEKRVGREELQDLLAMSESEDPEKRFMAASYLCRVMCAGASIKPGLHFIGCLKTRRCAFAGPPGTRCCP